MVYRHTQINILELVYHKEILFSPLKKIKRLYIALHNEY